MNFASNFGGPGGASAFQTAGNGFQSNASRGRGASRGTNRGNSRAGGFGQPGQNFGAMNSRPTNRDRAQGNSWANSGCGATNPNQNSSIRSDPPQNFNSNFGQPSRGGPSNNSRGAP